MKRNIFLKILSGLIALVFLLVVIIKIAVEPWIEKKLQTTLDEKFKDYTFTINDINVSIFQAAVTLRGITASSKLAPQKNHSINGIIGAVTLEGINPFKALFKKEISISEVILTDCRIVGKIPFPDKEKPPAISPSDIRVGHLQLDGLDIEIENLLDAQSYAVKGGTISFFDLQLKKHDTLSTRIIKSVDFAADELVAVSSDSMYTYKANGVSYSADENKLTVDWIFIQPSFKDHDFTSRYQFETDRFEAALGNIFALDFDAAKYINSGSLVSSYIEIGELDLDVFRDKRKEFRHVIRPAFQDVIYNYPGQLNIDSMSIVRGKIIYKEHAEDANQPGWISFEETNAQIYKISNDTVYKTDNAWFELKANAMLMGKGELDLLLKARLFDRQNTFSVYGTLYQMEGRELNPMIEKNAFFFVSSGAIEKMSFNFTADNARSTGDMTLLYKDLNLAVKNKRTDDTTAIVERVVSILANIKVMDSNPLPGEEVRVGVIEYERDPEKFLFNYCVKSILSGIKTSVAKSPKEKK